MPRLFRNYKWVIPVTLNVMALLFIWTKMCGNRYLKSKQRLISQAPSVNYSHHATRLKTDKKNESLTKDTPVTIAKSQDIYHFQDIPIINNYSFSYPRNVENACKSFKVDVFIPVHSHVANFKERANTRISTSGLYVKDKRNKAVQLFFVGLPLNTNNSNATKIQEMIRLESEKYGDIVQINIDDVYRNISLKAIAVLKWITEYCNNSELVLKIDDDVQFQTSKCVAALRQKKETVQNFVMSHIRRENRLRHLGGRYKVDIRDWPSPTYPPYVAGGIIGYPTSTALLLYQQTLRTKRLWLDDVFITGICRQKLGIPVFGSLSFIYRHDGYIN